MTFANRIARGVALSALALGSMGVVNAQNGTNYHVLNNNGDAPFLGIGAGGAQTALDGIGTYIPGEDVRGSLQVDFGGTLGIQFSYRNTAFRENACVFNPGTSGFVQIRFPGIYFIELGGTGGLNPNNPPVFKRPVCVTPLAASFIAYGTGPNSTASFVAAAASALGPTQTILLPNEGLVISGGGAGVGTATIVAGGTGQIPASPTGSIASGCYVVQFTWVGSAVPYLDNIDGVWHYAMNSDDGNQYWIMSADEMNLYQSFTVSTDAGFTAAPSFFQVIEYDFHWASLEANTTAILANHGIEQNGPYYAQTENMSPGPGGVGGPNFGFDVGRGSRAVSFSGLGGTKVPAGLGGLGNGAQDPAYGGGAFKTLGFATWDNKPNTSVDQVGSIRILWLGIDLAQLSNLTPEADPNVTKAAGTVRLPVIGTGFIQAITQTALGIFGHTTNPTTSGWPDPDGIASGAFGVPAVAGGSTQVNIGGFVGSIPCNIGVAVNLTYGTTGRDHSPPPALTWDPTNADISGSKEVYLWK